MMNQGRKPKLIVIAGPTASGKSSLAVELAIYLGGEIVNADSMQVYRWMDIGTAKPSKIERKGIPHHVIDVADPDMDFNAAIYRSFALPAIEEVLSRGKICFLVGGTGLYIKSLLGGLIYHQPSDPQFREKLRDEWRRCGSIFLHDKLRKQDPLSARKIHPHDGFRIIRALEIIHLTQKPLSFLIGQHGFGEKPFDTMKICLQTDREQLYDRINERSLDMIGKGLLPETERLINMGYSPEIKTMKSLGYRHMINVLEGRWDMDKAIEELQTDTRRYAKRQLTWFKADPEICWQDPEDFEGISKRIDAFNKSEDG